MTGELNIKEDKDYRVELVRFLFKGTLDIKNIENYGTIFSDDCRIHFFQDEFNLEYGKQFDSDLANAFDLKQLEINDIFSRQDSVYVYWTFHLIHKGEYHGIPATFKECIVKGMSIYKIPDQKIDEIWQFWDRGTLENIGGVKDRDASPNQSDFEVHYGLLKKLGMEKYVERASKLSKQERECLRIYLQGKTAKETGKRLHLSPRTVEYYFKNIKNKLDCWSKQELFTAAQILESLELL